MQIVLGSDVWTIVEDSSLRDRDGDSDVSIRTIRIHPHLHPECRLEVLVHEMLHAECEWMTEDAVTSIAKDIATALYTKFLYRCPELER